MLKVKPEYLSKRGKREFVILTIEDFSRMQEALADAADLRDLRKATKANAGRKYYSASEVERKLATHSARRK